MRRLALFLASALAGGCVFAARQPAFSVAAFNAAVPSEATAAVFSPYGFEIDCAILSDAYDTIEKAKAVEAIGALTGCDTVFFPILERYRDAATNGFGFASARAFLTPDAKRLEVRYRAKALDDYGVATCLVHPDRRGAESWLTAALDGRFGSVKLPEAEISGKRVSYREYIHFHPAWSVAFSPSRTSSEPFTRADGTAVGVPMMHGTCEVARWRQRRFTLVRLPLADEAWLYALLPAAGTDLAALRGELVEKRIDHFLSVMTSIVDPDITRGPASVAVPRLALAGESDLVPVFQRHQVPLAFKAIDAHEGMDAPRQSVRFVLDETGRAEPAKPSAAPADEVRLDRPFVFFVWHEPTRTMPVAGVFSGECGRQSVSSESK